MNKDLQDDTPSFLNMSDEELAAYTPPSMDAAPVEEDEPAQEGVSEEATPVVDEQETSAQSDGPESDVDTSPFEEEGADDAGPEKDQFQADEAEPAKPVEPKTPEEDKESPDTGIDYKAAYERLTAPFKANGREIQVQSVDDAIALMQMGANYNKKMAALKPNLKLLKLLENNGLLDEGKLNYLIDLEKKNPDAINKLVQESGLDPMGFDSDKASQYKPNTYTVDEREMELDTVLDELQSSPAYTQTLDVVTNRWDGESKRVIAGTPQILKVINDHIERGIYDVIQKEMERERMFGRLNGLSDIQAYRQVGDAIEARGGFAHLTQKRTEQGQPTPEPRQVVTPAPRQVDEDRLRDKRRAASAPRPAASSAAPLSGLNPLGMSDEEFSKVGLSKFM